MTSADKFFFLIVFLCLTLIQNFLRKMKVPEQITFKERRQNSYFSSSCVFDHPLDNTVFF